MIKKLLLTWCLSAAVSLAAVTCTSPNSTKGVLGQAAALSGCLSDVNVNMGDGLTVYPTSSDFSGTYGATMAWSITQSGSVYTYNYTFSDGNDPWQLFDQSDLRYVILGLSSSCTTVTESSTQGSNCIWDLKAPDNSGFQTTPTIGTFTSPAGLSSGLYGLYAEADSKESSYSISFKSLRVPVWQNVYLRAEGSETIYALNSGFGQTGSSFYIAAPDSVSAVPEPAHFGMLAAGVGSLIYMVRRKRA